MDVVSDQKLKTIKPWKGKNRRAENFSNDFGAHNMPSSFSCVVSVWLSEEHYLYGSHDNMLGPYQGLYQSMQQCGRGNWPNVQGTVFSSISEILGQWHLSNVCCIQDAKLIRYLDTKKPSCPSKPSPKAGVSKASQLIVLSSGSSPKEPALLCNQVKLGSFSNWHYFPSPPPHKLQGNASR